MRYGDPTQNKRDYRAADLARKDDGRFQVKRESLTGSLRMSLADKGKFNHEPHPAPYSQDCCACSQTLLASVSRPFCPHGTGFGYDLIDNVVDEKSQRNLAKIQKPSRNVKVFPEQMKDDQAPAPSLRSNSANLGPSSSALPGASSVPGPTPTADLAPLNSSLHST